MTVIFDMTLTLVVSAGVPEALLPGGLPPNTQG